MSDIKWEIVPVCKNKKLILITDMEKERLKYMKEKTGLSENTIIRKALNFAFEDFKKFED